MRCEVLMMTNSKARGRTRDVRHAKWGARHEKAQAFINFFFFNIYYLKWLAHIHYTHMYRLLATMLLDSYIG